MTIFFKIYSIVFISIAILSLFYRSLKEISKKEFWVDILCILLLIPLWYYIIFYSIAV